MKLECITCRKDLKHETVYIAGNSGPYCRPCFLLVSMREERPPQAWYEKALAAASFLWRS